MYVLKLRNATFSDAMGVFGSQLIPWHVYIGYYLGIIGIVYPIYEFKPTDLIQYNFIAYIAVISMLVLTLTGLDRLIPLFALPAEPKVRLRTDRKSTRLNSSHANISYAVFCLKKKKND